MNSRKGQNPDRTLHTFLVLSCLGFAGLVWVCIKTPTSSFLSSQSKSVKRRDRPKTLSQKAELFSTITVESVSPASFFVSYKATPTSLWEPSTLLGKLSFFRPSNLKEAGEDELHSLSGSGDKLEFAMKIDSTRINQGEQRSPEKTRRLFLRVTYL